MQSKVSMSKNSNVFELACRVVNQPGSSRVICILTVIGCGVAQGPPTVINDECPVLHVGSGILEMYKDDSQWLPHFLNKMCISETELQDTPTEDFVVVVVQALSLLCTNEV